MAGFFFAHALENSGRGGEVLAQTLGVIGVDSLVCVVRAEHLARAVARSDLAIMSTAGLVGWWLARERALQGMTFGVDEGALVIDIPNPPAGTTLLVRAPGGGRSIVPLEAA